MIHSWSVLAPDECKEDLPLVVKELSKLLLHVFIDRCILDRVHAQLLHVIQTEAPAQVYHQVVQRHSLVVKEARIIWTDRNFHTIAEEGACGVRAEIVDVAKDSIWDRATL